jgi:regulator of nucleoside diphosphate kinase
LIVLISTETTSVQDKERLITAVDRALSSWLTFLPHLESFRTKLRRARVLPPADVPDDMITMNSRFAVTDERSGETICYTLVFPGEEAAQQGKLSVLTPMGIALFGARVGDEVVWMSAAGPEVATVRRLLYQPEAAGHHRL